MLNSPIKKIIAVLSLFIIVPLIIVGVLYLLNRNHADEVKVKVLTVPDTATVTANGKPVKKNTYLKPGKYEFEAKQDGFESLKRTVQLTDGERVVVMPLLPESDEAKDWAANNQQAYLDVEAIEGERAQQAGEDFANANPITQYLPYTDSLYSINYGRTPDNTTIYIRIDASSPVARQVAVERIRSWGFDPTDYKIVFVGLGNPFDPSSKDTPGE